MADTCGVIIGCFGNKILSLLVLLTMCANLIYMAIYTVRDLKESDIDQIVTDINDQNPGGNIAFLHLHELTLGEMTYFFPNATHYVCDQTFTVLSTYDVFPSNIVNIGDISNISKYTDNVYTFSQMNIVQFRIFQYTHLKNCLAMMKMLLWKSYINIKVHITLQQNKWT